MLLLFECMFMRVPNRDEMRHGIFPIVVRAGNAATCLQAASAPVKRSEDAPHRGWVEEILHPLGSPEVGAFQN